MKRLAASENAIVAIPPASDPVQVRVPVVRVAVQIRDAWTAVLVEGDPCVGQHPAHCPSNTLRVVSNLGT